MNAPRELPARAAEIYREHGPRVLASKVVGFPKSVAFHRGLELVPREELRRHAAARDGLWIEGAESSRRISSTDVPPQLEEFSGTYDPAPRFLCSLSNCSLAGESAVGLLADGRILLDTAGSDPDHFFAEHRPLLGTKTAWTLALGTLASRPPSPRRRIRSPVLPLVPFYDNYYYPWLVEYLPKLRLLERYEAETGREPAVLIEEGAPSFVHETLALLGYGDRCLEWDGAGCRVDELLVTDHRLATSWAGPRYGFDLSYEDCRWVREALRAAVDAAPGACADGRRIYVSRRETERGRRIANHEEVESVLADYGFEPVVFESLSVADQIRLASSAEVLLSPHGAGFANMLFADDPLIVELFPETLVRPSYYLLSGLLGFEYEPMVVEASAHDPHDDLLVDPDRLAARLDGLLEPA
ncbi:glycosyltransferase family 61 protein [Natrononativus amylolyticus]|uniref:glycosyltransferase family 61 protein n=1 Tax=Natrononativus amylolyticus TaxID=2963434 RepID=UPI0020CF3529|nr:glycosyltransferase family 61 protein [Natrononativus amylolyticus]